MTEQVRSMLAEIGNLKQIDPETIVDGLAEDFLILMVRELPGYVDFLAELLGHAQARTH